MGVRRAATMLCALAAAPGAGGQNRTDGAGAAASAKSAMADAVEELELPVAGLLTARSLQGPPVYAGRRMWDDALEVRLRAFFAGLGGEGWLRKDGWRLTGEPPPPPPPPEFNETQDLLNTSGALLAQCNATEIALPVPTDLAAWEFVARVEETPDHPRIEMRLERTGPRVVGDNIIVRLPSTQWVVEDNYTTPWWVDGVPLAPWWEVAPGSPNETLQMDAWGGRRSAFYMNVVRYLTRNDSEVNVTAFEHPWLSMPLEEDFYVHETFCDTMILNCSAIEVRPMLPGVLACARHVRGWGGESEGNAAERRGGRGGSKEEKELGVGLGCAVLSCGGRGKA